MNGRRSKHNEYVIGVSDVLEIPRLLATCPHCGGEVGLWSREIETRCIFCNGSIMKEPVLNN